MKPNTVIVVVFPCNCDIASTEAIELAENVDPKLDRSLCVLTKPDLALEKQVQQDVIELASNQHESVRFKKGFVVVRGKGADDCGKGPFLLICFVLVFFVCYFNPLPIVA